MLGEVVNPDQFIQRAEDSDVAIDSAPALPDGLLRGILEPGDGSILNREGIGRRLVGSVDPEDFDIPP